MFGRLVGCKIFTEEVLVLKACNAEDALGGCRERRGRR